MLALGLALNLALNYHLVPIYGTWGAMCATTISGIAILGNDCVSVTKSGSQTRISESRYRSPSCTLILDTWLSTTCLGIALYLIVKTPWLLGESDKRLLAEHLQPLRKKFGF